MSEIHTGNVIKEELKLFDNYIYQWFVYIHLVLGIKEKFFLP